MLDAYQAAAELRDGDGAPASADAHLSEAKAVAAALENLGTDTTYLCCVDAAGNACFVTTSLSAGLHTVTLTATDTAGRNTAAAGGGHALDPGPG